MHGQRNKERKQKLKKLLPFLFVVLFLVVVVLVFSKNADQKKVTEVTREKTETQAEEVEEIHGIKCEKKKNIETYLFMGLDATGKVKATDTYDGTGQCDTLQLVVFDHKNNTYTCLPINRDTMTDVKSLDENGEVLGTTVMQISLAHATGDGLEESCENTVDAVSGLLYDQVIDGYASLNMDAIVALNHLVGGVPVVINDDFSQVDDSLKVGETVKLTDEQVMTFVRGRMDVGDGTNENRMKRQAEYLNALKPILIKKCQKDQSFALEIYDALEPYMVTSLSRNTFIKLAANMMEYEEQDTLNIAGTNAIGRNEFNEFTVDEDSLADVVIDLFYERLQEE